MPLVKFAITQRLSVGAGVRITELDPLLEPLLIRWPNCRTRGWPTPASGS